MKMRQQTQFTASKRLNKAELRQLSGLKMPDLFGTIYQRQLWGTAQGKPYFSGLGSHDPVIVGPYLDAVTHFFKSLPSTPVVVDLGCGDFAIGSKLCAWTQHYYACDIVPGLIEKLKHDATCTGQSSPATDKVTFVCLDAASDLLPQGDVLIVRQVLQHLSNQVIAAIIQQFQQYRYILVTEHLPGTGFIANKEKPNGPDTRLRWHSGVDVLQPPFNLKVANSRVLNQVADPGMPATLIETILYET